MELKSRSALMAIVAHIDFAFPEKSEIKNDVMDVIIWMSKQRFDLNG